MGDKVVGVRWDSDDIFSAGKGNDACGCFSLNSFWEGRRDWVFSCGSCSTRSIWSLDGDGGGARCCWRLTTE